MTEDRDALACLREARALLEWELELGGRSLAPSRRPSPPGVGPDAQARGGVRSDVADRHGTPVTGATSDARLAPREGGADPAERLVRLAQLAERASSCRACRLHEGRTKSVFARGSATARLAFVGEGPGANEDQQGLPFVGEAGQLLDKMIVAMGLRPDEVYVCNAVKCRPPSNRTPESDEMAACSPFLAEQLAEVRPDIIVALGRTAAIALGVMPEGGRNWRGVFSVYEGIPVLSTYHPAYLLRSPDQKRVVWADLQLVMARLATLPPR